VEGCFEWSEDDQQDQFLGFLAIGIDHFAVGDIAECLPFSITEKTGEVGFTKDQSTADPTEVVAAASIPCRRCR